MNDEAHQFSPMTPANFPELKRLPASARLKITEEQWDSAASDDLPVPASHKTLLRSSRAAYARGEANTFTMAELKYSIRHRS
ncbi:MAG: addiction module protein [Opitutaceae bacterium]|nr:addiction module protein [Opitutaceae bacterium]